MASSLSFGDSVTTATTPPPDNQQATQCNSIQTVKEAEILYRKALASFDKGSQQKAREYFGQALQRLAAMDADPAVCNSARDEFDRLFTKLDGQLYKQSCAAGPIHHFAMFDPKDNETVQRYIGIYSEGEPKIRVQRALEASMKYRGMILEALREFDMPEELVFLPVVESLYNNDDVSSAGAVGLWQFMPKQARAQNLKVNYFIDERKDPVKATRAACTYLKDLYAMFGNWPLALAAYNRGENGLGRDMLFSQAAGLDEMVERKSVPRETENYVPQFVAASLIGTEPEKYGFRLNYEPALTYDEVQVNNVIGLEVIAKAAGCEVDDLRDLNPQLRAWCTPPEYPNFNLRLPAGTKAAFAANIALVKDLNPSRGFVKYKVRKGDVLGRIAKKYGVSIASIRELNKMKKDRVLSINQVLLIRPGRKASSKS
jgi:membrane-bound lytic murein transglycosylase D